MSDIILVEVYRDGPLDRKLDVRCIATTTPDKLEGSKLIIDRVSFHGFSEQDYDDIVDAIETFRFRKKKRDRRRAQANPDQAGTPA